ncbi:sigma-70 family RNA polymerase sigma factor [Streptomyces sp. NPDC048506]|uniref:sigma-70 family RNA polymerase sigma factor n=1 Tax=Streptomyces sp. NPDC048506 TaxID=3155028 RepID=UPI00344165C1
MVAFSQRSYDNWALATDSELVEATRQGNMDAYGELWIRYAHVAVKLGQSLTRCNAEDIVSESFARILRHLRAGKGPTTNFRAYLFATVRTLIVDGSRAKSADTVLIGDPEQLVALAGATRAPEPCDVADMAKSSWNSLGERDQSLVWASAVQGYRTSEIGVKLGIPTPQAAVWLHRARKRLRTAFLTAHIPATDDPVCAAHRRRFAPYLQGKCSAPRRMQLDGHVAACSPCADAFTAARDVYFRMAMAKPPRAGTHR